MYKYPCVQHGYVSIPVLHLPRVPVHPTLFRPGTDAPEVPFDPPGRRPRRIVVKVGTRTLLGDGEGPDPERIRELAAVVAAYRETTTVVVSSGAVSLGARQLGLPLPPRTLRERQAAAAVGQARLIRAWSEAFREHGVEAGQLLLASDVALDRSRYLNARGALSTLLGAGIVPVVNENDSVNVDEGRVGDNDNLAAYAAALVDAELLVLLTDVGGIFDGHPGRDPEARLIPLAASPAELRRYCYGKPSRDSVGGMETKLDAAARAGSYGVPTVITGGVPGDALRAVYEGRPTGTRIEGAAPPLPARRRWMLMQARTSGRVAVDEGAAAAISRGGTSLLACGVVAVVGRFRAGDVVSIVDGAGRERARGITAFEDRELDRVRGRHSREIEAVLGYRAPDVVVRADKMVVMEAARPEEASG